MKLVRMIMNILNPAGLDRQRSRQQHALDTSAARLKREGRHRLLHDVRDERLADTWSREPEEPQT